MDGIVTPLCCPACGSQIPRAASDAEPACPACGRVLDANAHDPDDERLVADLRAAYSGGAEPRRDHLTATLKLPERFSGGAGQLPPGTRVGDFEIIAELGRGGMGVVYRARQLSLRREVALKVLPSYARYGQEAIQRFRAEAQAAARLHHTNVVAVYAQGELDGLCYYAMELIDGVGLDVVIRSRPDLLSTGRMRHASSSAIRLTGGSAARQEPSGDQPPPPTPGTGPRVARWTSADYRHLAGLVAEVADALALAHAQGVIHRDVKPHNLLLSQADRLHLTDFGLARLCDAPHLTVSGEVLGTPAYLSPEQVRADEVDHRTDIYSLGVTLYELITRRKPFEGQTRDQLMHAIVHADPVPLRRLDPRVPVDLETICLRAMERDPARRHPTAALLAEDLRRFAAGRPILSRRTSRLEKAAKWVLRHKAPSAAMAATAAVVALALILTWSWRTAVQGDVRRELHAAYARLAFEDFRQGGTLAAALDRAAQQGLADPELPLARALAALGAGLPADAIRILEKFRREVPGDVRGAYLLAWAHARHRDVDAAESVFAAAEGAGGPQSADGWFFRGMARHFEDPALAIESYRKAGATRAAAGGFYPQALLHLARARNQQMYATRSLESFEEARAGLRQLIDNGYYGAFPYYLLSITHRLAAEIYEDSSGTRPQLAAEHRSAALEWARRGAAHSPADDRPVTALAEALESAGDFPAAIAARTRAIELATADKRCEGYHYRWRLYYWTGDLAAAREDVAAHAACVPESRLYAHVYPALLAAEAGDLATARTHARAIAAESPTDPQAILWSATCLRLFGATAEAERLLTENLSAVDFANGLHAPQTPAWIHALYLAVQSGVETEDLQTLAAAAAAPWKLLAEADFHLAVAELSDGRRTAALQRLRDVYRAFDGEEGYTYLARLLLVRSAENRSWPAWLELSLTEEQVAGDAATPAEKG